MKYAEVILPLPLDNTYTYLIPPEMEASVQPGLRVVVPFGKKRYFTAIVRATRDEISDASYALKEIFAVLDASPVLLPPQMAFWEWMASYYICKPGDVYKAAVPSGLMLESETVVYCCHDAGTDESLTLREQLILDAFADENSLTVSRLEKITRTANLIPALNRLMQRGIVTVSEELKKGFAPKRETCIRLHPAYRREEDLAAVLPQLKRAVQQEKLLLAYIERAEPFSPAAPPKEISKKQLLEATGVAASVPDSLVRRGWMEYYARDVSRLPSSAAPLQPLHPLTPPQQTALREIKDVFETKQVCLLHGVPASGKTEIYLHLASEALAQGRQVLYLLPEIAVTTQITERLRSVLGDRLRVYHSGIPDAGRVEIWNELVHRRAPVVALGVRSSLFLPFANLGLVIVDEEHETSYKQHEPAPRYHARSAAVMLAHMHGAKTLLGSATPSLDSIYNAKAGKYGLVTLPARYGEGLRPQIHLVDTKELRRKKIMKDGLLSPFLHRHIDEALGRDEQVILLRNRRGFAPVMECRSCGEAVRCIHCDVSLTYHREQNRLVCHYCGYSMPPPSRCPACGHPEMKWVGFGTEKVEDEIAALFPSVRTARLDLDTARTRRECERILTDFGQGRSRILIGTQMVSKGLDFGRVTVVGVLNADGLMNVPDFRAYERAFQMMMQAGGRAGRRDRQGTVVIQTAQPAHPLLQMLQAMDFEGMVSTQLYERYLFRYPPYFRLITVVMRCRDGAVLDDGAAVCARHLEGTPGVAVHGPFAPPVGRVQ
ncbi:MAG: primosomal protein N', partial [Tannerella sp.]|nr:primosomal protein N' [Tannerella sp.]